MSDVREQIAQQLETAAAAYVAPVRSTVLADAILERFDVTPKPVVTPEELGRIVAQAWYSTDNAATRGDIGKAVLLELAEAGLQIVRVDE